MKVNAGVSCVWYSSGYVCVECYVVGVVDDVGEQCPSLIISVLSMGCVIVKVEDADVMSGDDVC